MSYAHKQLPLGKISQANSPDYVRRDPEKSVLYQTVSKNYNTFLRVAEIEGKKIPAHVIEELDAFLRCGILAYGFMRLQCETCKHERIVALSCKKRGICSSCGGKRMAETAANLVDYVIPKVGVRQWVVSFPFQIRYLLARESKTQSKCIEIVLRAITTFLKKKVKKQGAKGILQTGTVTVIQRSGGSINLNPHLHILALDGAYDTDEAGNADDRPPRFHWIRSLTDDEVKVLVKTIGLRVVRYLKKQGHFEDETGYIAEENSSDLMPSIQSASVQSKIALGDRKGQKVRRLGSLGQIIDIHPESSSPLCAQIEGFSLHAATYCAPWERHKLEKLARYLARPAVAEERLRILPSGEVGYKLKKEYSDGTSHLMFSPLEFMEKLAAIIPQPRFHMTRYHGCLGPNAKIRSLIVPKPEEKKKEPQSPAEVMIEKSPEKTKNKQRRRTWAEMLARIFAIDMSCPNCQTELKPVAAIFDPQAIERILNHLGLPSKPPDIAPARFSAAIEYCQS